MLKPHQRPNAGALGEKRIVKIINCPNCARNLVQYPKGHPLIDVRCESCEFKAQLKVNNCKPKKIVFGAGWDILDKHLKAGFLPLLRILFMVTTVVWRRM